MKYIPYIVALLGAIILIVDLFDLYTPTKWTKVSGYLLMLIAIIMMKFCPCNKTEDVPE